MPVIVNDYELTDAEMEQELPAHQDQPDPLKSAMTALVLRRLLLQKAAQLNLTADDEEALIDALLASEVRIPEADTEACRRHYDANLAHYRAGELVEASHILFQVTAGVNLDALRARADQVLQQLLAEPQLFAELAAQNSNCESSREGGNLGQLTRGQTVPEFEKAVFAAEAGKIMPRLLETRFGLHIVQVGRKAEGQQLPFEHLQPEIAELLTQMSYERALKQYLQLLVGQARISGIELAGADSPLLQ